MQVIICITHFRETLTLKTKSVRKQLKGQKERVVTYFVKLMKAKCDAHHNDGEGTIVSPSVACRIWRGGGKVNHLNTVRYSFGDWVTLSLIWFKWLLKILLLALGN